MLEKIDINNISDYLCFEGDWLFELSNMNYSQLKEEQNNIESIILLNWDKIENLDFFDTRNRAFILLLFDFSERLQLSTCIQVIYNLLQNQKIIDIGYRLKAALLFNIGIQSIELYIDRFDEICSLLMCALKEEEDDTNKVFATFANYYLTVLGRNPLWIEKLRQTIFYSLNKYCFLSSAFISQLLAFDISNYSECNNSIQKLKDQTFSRKRFDITNNQLLIEENTDYVNQLKSFNSLSFNTLRKVALSNVDFKSQLADRGVAPIESEKDLFIFLKDYGNMHYAKMSNALEFLPINEIVGDIEIIDWGCGQALATIIFLEFCKLKNLNININVILIEPSEICIKRAALHTKLFNPKAKIKTVCKYIDDLNEIDILTAPNKLKIHLFSNILDVELYSMDCLQKLISKSQKGGNFFVCASPYINDLKTERIESFCKFFSSNNSYKLLGSETNGGRSQDEYWNCNNNYKNRPCNDHPLYCNGQYKWTRVIRVFKINI